MSFIVVHGRKDCDECQIEEWFTGLGRARAAIETGNSTVISTCRRRHDVRTLLILTVAVVAICTNPPVRALAQDLEPLKAQFEMLERINAAVSSFASSIGAGSDLQTYCHIELSMHTRQPADGLVPFGVNYNNIRSQDELDQIIDAREAYERNYLMLCLARAKRDLDAVE